MKENSEKCPCISSVSSVSEIIASKLCILPALGRLPSVLVGRGMCFCSQVPFTLSRGSVGTAACSIHGDLSIRGLKPRR